MGNLDYRADGEDDMDTAFEGEKVIEVDPTKMNKWRMKNLKSSTRVHGNQWKSYRALPRG